MVVITSLVSRHDVVHAWDDMHETFLHVDDSHNLGPSQLKLASLEQ